MKRALLFCALGIALLGSQVAKADNFAGTASFTDTDPITNNNVYFTGTFDNPNFSFSGGVGTVYTDNLTITGYDLNLVQTTESDDLEVALSFTLPDPASSNIGGTGSITDTFYGFFYGDSDTIEWTTNDPATVNFADGSQLVVNVPNVTFLGIDGGLLGPGTNSGVDPVTFTVTAAAPEPGSLALLGTSILGGAGILRRRFRA